MGLFDGKQNAGPSTEQPKPGAGAAQNESANMGDQSYFDEMAGNDGQFTADMMSTPYLSMVQPGGTAAANGHTPGTWMNSASGENFGEIVEVICLACRTAWIERDSVNKSWMTVGRYEPNSIEVTKTMPKPGQRGFPTMVNPQSGNKVEELFVYAVMLKEHPEAGVLFFSPTAISMSACKAWNAKINNQRLPDGRQARTFAFSWKLSLTQVPKPGSKTEFNTKLGTAERGELVQKDAYQAYVKPQIGVSQNLLMLAAPDAAPESAE